MATERTALEILNTVEDELGLSRSTGLASTAITTRQILAFMNATVEEMNKDGDWSGIEQEAVIEIGAPSTVSATLVDGSASITIADTTPFSAAPKAWTITGESIQRGSRVLSVTSATVLLLDRTAEASIVEDVTFVRDTFAFPSDFGRWIPQTHWDATLMWELVGPTSSQYDAYMRNGIVGPFPRRQYRRQGLLPTAFRIFPPASAEASYPATLTFRYISNEPIVASGGTTKRFFTLDADTTPLPDRVIILGTKWRWKEQKGFDFAPQQLEYYNQLDGFIASDNGPATVPLDGPTNYGFPDSFRYGVQDGNFPGG